MLDTSLRRLFVSTLLIAGCGSQPAPTDTGGGCDVNCTDASGIDGGSSDASMSDGNGGSDTTPPTDAEQTDGSTLAYPTTPPARICDDTAMLSGPATAPAGAIVVHPSDNLSTVTDDAPAGSTFYLTAGVHHLALGEFEQVIPKDNNVYIGAPGAILDGQHSSLYAFTQHARNVTLRNFTIQNFGTPGSTNNEGVVNHDAGEGWVVEYMTIQQNAGAGLFVGSGNRIHHNCLRNNGQYGFSAYSDNGIRDVILDHNEIAGNNTDDWETRVDGCGCTGGGKFWATTGATVSNNYVHDNHSVGIWADTNNVRFDITGNYIENNAGPGVMYEISYNARIAWNTFVRNALVDGPTNPGFPTGAIYLSEAGGDSRVDAQFTTLEIAHNHFVDNWSGVVLWENADRFCNSPANSSSGDCTLGGAATLATCSQGMIANAPYLSDCRWKTQNVQVHDNLFEIAPANIGASCTRDNSCGLQGLFSNFGTFPNWSPYMDETVEDAITLHQGNVFANNTYVGPWAFMAHDQGTVLDFAAWRAAPYNQDMGSTTR